MSENGTDTDARAPEPSAAGARVDFGPGALVAAVAVLVLLLAAVLPWTGLGASGWEVVLGRPGVTGLPRLFGTLAVVFGVVGTAVTLSTRRWPAVFVTAAGCTITSVTGLWAIWSQNTSAGVGPGVGLWLALLAMIVLAGRWASYALSRR
ncbi:hypothetical protein Acsp06_13790 [Actinomycetospora sp. NBRC 106375]|uniref:Rv2732c family membrane protein n=1 Tax=Actinomycetospora sp. NBRC 106375 TaxID=3032207 RepID=UPI0024A0223C|nr:hypothetical protein [Actinomycetospora sp. NBRC 106375]GLZ45194.1 hypothetical protein Acsp06_13790 [Actinomycetospora sp. NBRC 106375]